MAEFCLLLAGISLLATIFFVVCDFIGGLVLGRLGIREPTANLFIGLTVIVALAAIVCTSGITIFLFPVCLIGWLVFRYRSEAMPFNFKSLIQENRVLPLLILLNILVRFFQLYDPISGTLFTDYTDQYNYIDQVNLLLRHGLEADFLSLEAKTFGEGYRYTPYHYFEVYISVWGKWLTPFTTFEIFEFFTLPLLVSFAQIQLIRISNFLFSVPRRSAMLWIFVVTSCFRYFQFTPFANGDFLGIKSFGFLSYFPLYAITSEHTLYFYSFIFKVSGFVLVFSTWYAGYRIK